VNKKRVQKIITEAGVCSRRKAEDLIQAGRVKVNEKVITIGDQADPTTDRIFVDGKRLHIDEKWYLAFYKPRNVVTTLHDPQKRKTIKQYLKDIPVRVYPVGRLDFDAEGLLLLSNDGEFANKVMHPRYQKRKTYEVTVDKSLTQEVTQKLKSRIKLEDGNVTIHAANQLGSRTIEITIHEGRNRIVKRIFETFGLTVTKLKRIQVGKVKLGDLKPGTHRRLTKKEISDLAASI
jgi:23S rRNA pseudouridine2605 synthase